MKWWGPREGSSRSWLSCCASALSRRELNDSEKCLAVEFSSLALFYK